MNIIPVFPVVILSRIIEAEGAETAMHLREALCMFAGYKYDTLCPTAPVPASSQAMCRS
jgi:hypothetical protein